MFESDDTREFLKSLIRVGEVSSVDASAGTARVVFDDDDSVVSNDLQVVSRNTFANQDYAMPDIGEDVICLFLPTGTEEGFILGSVYAGEVTPPESSIDKRTVVFSDDTRISYDRSTHTLSVKIDDTTITVDKENVDIESSKNVKIKGSITLDGDVKITGKVTADGDVSTSGKVTATGDISTSGDVKTATVQLNTHMHLCAAPGATSGPPVMTPVAPETEG